jgi:hypothetical protein
MPKFQKKIQDPDQPSVEPVVEAAAADPVFTTVQAQVAWREGKSRLQCESIESFNLQRLEELRLNEERLRKNDLERMQEEAAARNPKLLAEKHAQEKQAEADRQAEARRLYAERIEAEKSRILANQERARQQALANEAERERLHALAHPEKTGSVVRLTPVRACADNYCNVPLDGTTPHKPWCAEHLRKANYK